MSEEPITRRLVSFLIKLNYEELPDEVVEKARECVLDQIGVELAGSVLAWNKIIYEYGKSLGSKGNSTIVYYGDKVSAQDAAFVNSTFGQGCELDDVGFGSGGHPTAATLPVGMALADQKHVDGRSFITAVVAGWDVMYRLNSAIQPHAGKRGFHSQGIVGPFAAAATAGKLLRLDEQEMLNAFGIAGSHSAGPMEHTDVGGDVKRMHSGLAARGGIQSAVLAQMGLTGPHTIIEGKKGFCRIFADHHNMNVITEKLGEEFKILNAWFKLYPCAGVIQSSVNMMANIVNEQRVEIHDVSQIEIGLAASSINLGGSIFEPHDVTAAQFSLPFSLGVRLLKNSNELCDYMDQSLWHHPAILDVIKKTKIYADPEAVGDKRYSTRIKMRLKDGRELRAHEPYPKGSPRNPMSKDDLRTKFLRLTQDIIDRNQAERINEVVDRLEKLMDLRDLTKLLIRDRVGEDKSVKSRL
jgi:2-methylcitrate dehydratase PrpD